MKLTIRKATDLKAARWAGGTTTQLAIYPESSEYTKMNFQFRISRATVEIEESTFTFMPGVKRHLMILDGALFIDHKGRYRKQLDKFGYDIFDGEWPTTAKGKVSDFNLMTRGKSNGKLQALVLNDRKESTLDYGQGTSYSSYFILNGQVRLICGTNAATLSKGDFALLDHEQEDAIVHMQSIADSEIIVASVKL
jgi:environmental stress-induced protein Ves